MNRVTVFERPDGAGIYIEWWDDSGRNKKVLTRVVGKPITDRELAKEIARDVSRKQEKIANNQARTLWRGYQPGRTLGELFEEYHDAHEEDWSDEHLKHQRRFRRFWTDRLGEGATLASVTAAKVERIASETARERDWAKRTRRAYLMYIKAAFRYGEEKLKWIDQRHNLSAVDLPSANKKPARLSYTLEEATALLEALQDVDERAWAVGEIALQTGRRLNAIRNLAKADVEDAGDHVVLRFRADTDKSGQEGESVVAGGAVDAVRGLMYDGSPWLFPRQADPERPVAPERLTEMLHEAEEAAGVEHVKGRAWHGFKRLFATLAANHPAARHQASTRRETLEGRYEQDTLAPKKELAQQLASRREGK